jgi:hypothetical protein
MEQNIGSDLMVPDIGFPARGEGEGGLLQDEG